MAGVESERRQGPQVFGKECWVSFRARTVREEAVQSASQTVRFDEIAERLAEAREALGGRVPDERARCLVEQRFPCANCVSNSPGSPVCLAEPVASEILIGSRGGTQSAREELHGTGGLSFFECNESLKASIARNGARRSHDVENDLGWQNPRLVQQLG